MVITLKHALCMYSDSGTTHVAVYKEAHWILTVPHGAELVYAQYRKLRHSTINVSWQTPVPRHSFLSRQVLCSLGA